MFTVTAGVPGSAQRQAGLRETRLAQTEGPAGPPRSRSRQGRGGWRARELGEGEGEGGAPEVPPGRPGSAPPAPARGGASRRGRGGAEALPVPSFRLRVPGGGPPGHRRSQRSAAAFRLAPWPHAGGPGAAAAPGGRRLGAPAPAPRAASGRPGHPRLQTPALR